MAVALTRWRRSKDARRQTGLIGPNAILQLLPVLEQAGGVFLFASAAVVLKAGIVIAVVAFALRQGLRLGILSGFSLAQTGEFSFILAAAAASGWTRQRRSVSPT